MRHRVAKRHLSRSPAHLKAMRRNLAQSLLQYGQVETTLQKAKEVRPFVEKLITIARKGTLRSRQRVSSLLNDRSILNLEEEEEYGAMSDAQRHKVMVGRSGRRHRSGTVPASYNKKKISFVAQSIVHKLMTEVAPKFQDRPGGYTRIIRLSKRRIGDNSDLAILQLVGREEESTTPKKSRKKSVGQRRQKTLDRIRYLEGKSSRRSPQRRGGTTQSKDKDPSAKVSTKEPSKDEAPVSPDAEGKAEEGGADQS